MMKTILVINDHSSEAEHAAELALSIAQKVNANLLLAHIAKVKATKLVHIKQTVSVSGKQEKPVARTEQVSLQDHLQSILSKVTGFKPSIVNVDMTDFNEADIAQVVIKNNIWMMVKGTCSPEDVYPVRSRINIQAVLNRVRCPLLLVPEKFEIKDFEHIVYTADLRYSRLPIVQYLAEIAASYKADLMVAHLSAKGIPHMEENYAQTFFDGQIGKRVKYTKLGFNNIRERNLITALDVMVNGMRTDLLAMVNHRFHFQELIGRYITNPLPAHITVPVMVFPY